MSNLRLIRTERLRSVYLCPDMKMMEKHNRWW